MEEKQIQEHQGHVQQALKCPRCDSSNTKFCYYNNYSLSQPRHFCKACKRYWTRGGTLRNVPVGGGYRKNKRVKKGNSVVDHHREISSSSSATPGVNPSGVRVQSSQGVDTSLLSARPHINNPLLYSLLTNNRSEVSNLPYSMRDSYGLNLPQFKVGGNGELGFSSVTSQKAGGGGGELGFSSVTSQKVTGTTGELGFSSVTSQNLGLSGTNMSLASLNHPLLSSTYPTYGTSTSTSTMAPSQQKIVSYGYNDIAQTPYGFMGFDDLQMLRNSNNEGYDMFAKDVKMEGHGNWFDSLTNQNYVQEINSLDQSFMWSSSVGAGVRSNPSNIGC